ncbi:MAG: TlpA family protein disulfide reductase [Bacteroidales bacterium]|nr:TlpA family protein disulfide reductase [Bacteroidales bacterium]
MKKHILIFLLGIVCLAFSTIHFLADNAFLTFISLSFLSLISSLYLRSIKLNFFIKLLLFTVSWFILIGSATLSNQDINYLLYHLQEITAISIMFTIGNFINFKKYKKRSVLLIILALIFITLQFAFTKKIIYDIKNIAVNEQQFKKIPDFEIIDLENNKITQNDFKGKVVFFDFWAVTCGQCIAQFPSIEKIMNNFKDNPDVKFYLINYNGPSDDLEYIRKFVKKREIKIPVLFDKSASFAAKMNCFAFPHSFIIDKNLNIRYHHAGYQKSTENVYIKDVTKRIKIILNE